MALSNFGVLRSPGKLAVAAVIAVALTMLLLQSRFRQDNLVPPAHAASVDYFLKIDGIDGESSDDRHKGEIEIESFSWGASQTGHAGGGGGGAGKVVFQDIHFTTATNKASPKLFQSVAEGKHFPEAVLVARKSGGDQQEYLKIKFSDILVSSYQQTGDAGGTTDEFSLNFAKIEYSYSPQGADGRLEAPVVGTWDLKANKK